MPRLGDLINDLVGCRMALDKFDGIDDAAREKHLNEILPLEQQNEELIAEINATTGGGQPLMRPPLVIPAGTLTEHKIGKPKPTKAAKPTGPARALPRTPGTKTPAFDSKPASQQAATTAPKPPAEVPTRTGEEQGAEDDDD